MQAIVHTDVFYNMRSEFNPGMSKFAGAFWNAKCFSASLLTVAAHGQPPVPIRLSVFDLVNLQKHLANLLALPIATCVAGGAAGQFNQTCEVPKTTLSDQAIFVVAFYDPLVNATLPQVDYIFEILTAAFATGLSPPERPSWTLISPTSHLCRCSFKPKTLWQSPVANPAWQCRGPSCYSCYGTSLRSRVAPTNLAEDIA